MFSPFLQFSSNILFFSLINGNVRKRSFKLNTAFNSYDIFKSWKAFCKLFHKNKSLWNINVKAHHVVLWIRNNFTEILVLRYDFQKLISYKFTELNTKYDENYFDFENNFWISHDFFNLVQLFSWLRCRVGLSNWLPLIS